MANFGLLLLTTRGINEQYKAQAGSPLKFKRIAMGSGSFTGNSMALSKLVKEEVSVDISKGYIQNDSYVVEGFFSNEGLATGFAWREIGLFVEDENGNEILYSYANAGASYDYIPPTTDERYSKYIRIATAIGNATNISIVESEGFIAVDVRTFNAAVEEFRTDISALWPSKTASGKALAIGDSATAPFVGLSIYGKSEQIATEGNQLANIPDVDDSNINGITWSSEGGVVRAKGTSTAISSSGMKSIAAVITGLSGTFYISGDTEGVKVLASIKASDETTKWVHNQSFTLDGTETNITVYCQIESGVTVDAIIYPMLNAGDSPLEWEPYTGVLPSPSPEYPQEISSIGDDGEVIVSVYGKNLLNIINSGATAGVTETVKDGLTSFSGTATGNGGRTAWKRSEVVTLVPGTYYLSMNVPSGVAGQPCLTASGESRVIAGGVGKFTITENTDVYFGFNYESGITYNAQNVAVQLELGSTPSEYEPYKEKQIITLATADRLAGIPVSKGGNCTDENGQQWICDEIDLARGVYVQRVFTEERVFSYDSINNRYSTTLTHTANAKCADGNGIPVLCDILEFNPLSGTGSPTINGIRGAMTSPKYVIAYYNGEAIDTATVCYPLATPIETALTDEEIAAFKALTTYNPCTTIVNDAGAEVAAEYVTQSHEGLVGMLLKRIADLEATLGNINAILESINGGE